MNNYRDLFLSVVLVITCAGLPQFTGTSTAPFLVALLGCFTLIWRLARVQADQEERVDVERALAKGESDSK